MEDRLSSRAICGSQRVVVVRDGSRSQPQPLFAGLGRSESSSFSFLAHNNVAAERDCVLPFFGHGSLPRVSCVQRWDLGCLPGR